MRAHHHVDIARLAARIHDAYAQAVSRNERDDRLARFMREAKLTTRDVACVLRVGTDTVSNKVALRRKCTPFDIERLLIVLSECLGRRVTFEELFARLSPDGRRPRPIGPRRRAQSKRRQRDL